MTKEIDSNRELQPSKLSPAISKSDPADITSGDSPDCKICLTHVRVVNSYL